MTLLDQIIAAKVDTATLDLFLSRNSVEIIDWFSALPHKDLLALRKKIRDFVLIKPGIWRDLPNHSHNLAFLTMLLEKSAELGDLASFKRLYSDLSGTSVVLGSRLKAASLYLAEKPKDATEYVGMLETIYELLAEAVRCEDDDADKALTTMVHYYAIAIAAFGDYHPVTPSTIHDWIARKIALDPTSFLRCPLIDAVLAVTLAPVGPAVDLIVIQLDHYLSRTRPMLIAAAGMYVEEGTTYCDLLAAADRDFEDIRDISVTEHNANPNRQSDYDSLSRGTTIIDREGQLWAYMTAYGPMHSEKLRSAFDPIPFGSITGPVTVVDWGCGQGTATMTLYDYLRRHGITLDIHEVQLVEPSTVALSRGGIHTLKFDGVVGLHTIPKRLDHVVSKDFHASKGTTLHLFSNILDVTAVSLAPLISLVKSSFPGPNLFVCVSPYVDYSKRYRLDAFRDAFKSDHYAKIFEADDRAGDWVKRWTRIVRVFTAEW